MTYLIVFLLGAAVGGIAVWADLLYTLRRERHRRGGDISEAMRGARR